MTRFPLIRTRAAGAFAAALAAVFTASIVGTALPANAGPRVPPPAYSASPNLPDGWGSGGWGSGRDGYDSRPRSRARAPQARRANQPIWRDRGLFSSSRRSGPESYEAESYGSRGYGYDDRDYGGWDRAPAPRRSRATPPPRQRFNARPAPQRQHAPSRRAAKRPARKFDPAFLPTVVDYDGGEAPGTIIIDTPSRYLYLVEGGGTARRYGVGVGRPGFQWAGEHKVTRKAEWPEWRPPAEMRKRQPGLPTFMPGGPRNPLGARALYLGSTLYRIHGSNEPWTIGHAVSSGCIRMRNQDVEDLYARVDVGTKVIVH